MTAAMTKRLIMPVALLRGSPHDWPPSTASLTLGEGEIAPQPAQENNGIAASWLFANDFGVMFGPRARVNLAARENVSARQCYKVGHAHHPLRHQRIAPRAKGEVARRRAWHPLAPRRAGSAYWRDPLGRLPREEPERQGADTRR